MDRCELGCQLHVMSTSRAHRHRRTAAASRKMRPVRFVLLMLLATPVRMVLVVVKRLRAGSCSTSSSSCPRAPPQCEAEPSAPCASLAILKVPRTGSTWLTKELRALGAAVALEFEPFTDGAARTCPGRFYTLGLGRALGHRLRCVTREARSLSCY